MAIQQTQSSGSSSGVMGFLFQDDGGTDSLVLEGEGFAMTLHQLLGEYEADAPTPMAAELAAMVTSDEAELADLTAPLTAALDSLTRDFALPAQGAALPVEAGWEGGGDGQEPESELEHAPPGIAPFTNAMTALQEHTVMPAQQEPTNAVTAPQHDTAAPARTFEGGIQHLIELARDVQDAAAALTQAAQAASQPAPAKAAGRNLPGNGKSLPQGFKPLALTQAMAGMQARQAQAAAANELPLVSNPETSGSPAFGTLIADLQSAETRASTITASAAPAIIQGLRGESTLPALAQSLAETTETQTPQFQSEYLAGTDAWFEDLGTRIEWLNDMNIEQADLQLHPAELGLLEIQISTTDDGTTVSFVTHNADARALIEDSLPKLRELLASQGMQLGESQVSQHSEGGQRGRDTHPAPNSAARDESEASRPTRRTAYIADPNRIDHYV